MQSAFSPPEQKSQVTEFFTWRQKALRAVQANIWFAVGGTATAGKGGKERERTTE